MFRKHHIIITFHFMEPLKGHGDELEIWVGRKLAFMFYAFAFARKMFCSPERVSWGMHKHLRENPKAKNKKQIIFFPHHVFCLHHVPFRAHSLKQYNLITVPKYKEIKSYIWNSHFFLSFFFFNWKTGWQENGKHWQILFPKTFKFSMSL